MLIHQSKPSNFFINLSLLLVRIGEILLGVAIVLDPLIFATLIRARLLNNSNGKYLNFMPIGPQNSINSVGIIKSTIPRNIPVWLLFSITVISIIVLIGYLLIFNFLIKILKNIRSGEYFIAANIHLFSRIIHLGIVQIILYAVSFSITRIGYHQIGETQPLQFNFSSFIIFILLIVSWVFYIVLKRGVALQEDNDSMI